MSGISSNPKIDMITGQLVVLSTEHHEVHEGKLFSVYHSDIDKGKGATINLYMKTPASDVRAHVIFSWASSGAAYAFIREAPTVTSDTGTPVAIINRNRNSNNVTTMLNNADPVIIGASTDVTITEDGGNIYERFSGAARADSALVRGENYFEFQPDTVYCAVVVSDAAGLTLACDFCWHEG